MKAVTILTRCRCAEADKRRIRQRIQQRREAVERVTPRMNADGGGYGTAEPDRMVAYAEAIDTLERTLLQRTQEHQAEVSAACALLDTLPDAESVVLHQYYVLGGKVEAIAQGRGYTTRHVCRLKRSGEEMLEDIPEGSIRALLPDWYQNEKT